MKSLPPIPANPGEERLEGYGEMALFYLGADTPEARRTMVRLATEVPPEQRAPTIKEGRHRISFKSWMRAYYQRLADQSAAVAAPQK